MLKIPDELGGRQRDREAKDILDDRPGRGRGGNGPGRARSEKERETF